MMTIADADADERQRRAFDAPPDASLAILGPAGSGKTTTLVRRARRIALSGPVALLTPSDDGTARLALRVRDEPRIACPRFGEIAFDVLRDACARDGVPYDVTCIDDVRASMHFERAGAELYALGWTEFDGEIDPEITGLRSPERFSAAAFRLIRKLRASLVSPADFRAVGLRGAATFYATPPNFADAGLIVETKPKHHDSLRVSPAELERQHRREIDLVKILARLYESYVDTLVRNGCMTPTDAIYEAALALRARPELGAGVRARYGAAFVDDAQDLTGGQTALLSGAYGDALARVTLAGDAAQATRGFSTGARGSEVLGRASTVVTLETAYRSSPAIARVARRALDPRAPAAGEADASDGVTLYRADSVRDEARFVATEIESLIRAGTPPERIAVIVRDLGGARSYADAILARDVPVDCAGAASLYEFPVVVDALAALWTAIDPFRHDYLLRALEAPWMRLSDASLAVLCAEAAEPQPLLFELPGDEPESGDRRWDRRRSLRLGRNVTRGDADADLPADARERLVTFRAARDRWERAARTLDPTEHARLVLDESVLATLAPGARGRFDAALVARLLGEIDDYVAREPLAALEDFLIFAERAAAAESDLLAIRPHDRAAVRVVDVEAAKGDEFDAVFLVDARAGAWPRYYVPDAFLFLPSLGMIPKENVGDADAAQTAKFTYALVRFKIRDKYVAEERRAFSCAASRARVRLTVSAPGRPTRGVAAPEILEELLRARSGRL